MINRMKPVAQIANFYKARAEYHGNTAIIHYPVLGQGSIISAEIEQLIDAVRIKMIPSERKLEVELL